MWQQFQQRKFLWVVLGRQNTESIATEILRTGHNQEYICSEVYQSIIKSFKNLLLLTTFTSLFDGETGSICSQVNKPYVMVLSQ